MLKRSYQEGLERSRLTLDEEEERKEVKKTDGLTWMLVLTCFLSAFGSSFVHGYSTGVLNAPEFVSNAFILKNVNP
jgi:hypothetical protein